MPEKYSPEWYEEQHINRWSPYWPDKAPSNAFKLSDGKYYDKGGNFIKWMHPWLHEDKWTNPFSSLFNAINKGTQTVNNVLDKIPNTSQMQQAVQIATTRIREGNQQFADFGIVSGETVIKTIQKYYPNRIPLPYDIRDNGQTMTFFYHWMNKDGEPDTSYRSLTVPKSELITMDDSLLKKQSDFVANQAASNNTQPTGQTTNTDPVDNSGYMPIDVTPIPNIVGNVNPDAPIVPSSGQTGQPSGDLSSSMQDYIDALSQPAQVVTERFPLPNQLNFSQMLAIETDCPILWRISQLPIEQQIKIMMVLRDHARNLQFTRRLNTNGTNIYSKSIPQSRRQGKIRKQRKTRKRNRSEKVRPGTWKFQTSF